MCGLSRASDTRTHCTYKQKNEPDRIKQWQMCFCASVKDTAVASTLLSFLLSLLTGFGRIYSRNNPDNEQRIFHISKLITWKEINIEIFK